MRSVSVRLTISCLRVIRLYFDFDFLLNVPAISPTVPNKQSLMGYV